MTRIACTFTKLVIKSTHDYFNTTPDNYYNTYHVEQLKILGMKYEIIGEFKYKYGSPIRSCEIFRATMRKLFELKKYGNRYAKEVMNNFYSSLSQKKELRIPIEDYNMNGRNHDASRVVNVDLQNGLITLESDTKPFKHKLGRIQSFTLAYARLTMIQILLLVEKRGYKIYQCNTDGFITNCKPHVMNTKIWDISTDMGDLKVEKILDGKWIIHDVHRVEKH